MSRRPWNKGLKGIQISTRKNLTYEEIYGKEKADKVKEKMSKAHIGKILTKEHREHISECQRGEKHWLFGKHHTEETKRKIRESLKGREGFWKGKHLSKKTKEKLSEAHKGIIPWIKGKHHTEEAIEKMRKSHIGAKAWNKGKKTDLIPWNKGKHWNEEMKRKLRMYQLGTHHSRETKIKMSEAQKGEKSYLWKGGITPLTKKIRSSFKYRQWRSDIFTRDDFTCQDCGRRGLYIEAHHEEAFADIMEINDIKTFEQSMDCEELWNINNGITLCRKCHNKNKNGRRERIKKNK